MTLPPSLMPDGIPTTLLLAHDAIKKRLDHAGDFRSGQSWTYHDGAPDPSNLPNETVGVWLEFNNISRDKQRSTFVSDANIGTWTIHIVVRDIGTDRFGFDQTLGIRVLGDVFAALSTTLGDVSLDGAVDYTDDYGISARIGSPSGGDRRVMGISFTFKAYHPLTNSRAP